MSLAIVRTRASSGLSAPAVTVEVHLSNGLPSFSIVGLPETVVRESRERVRSALLTSGYNFPARRITVNLAPADLPKEVHETVADWFAALGVHFEFGDLTQAWQVIAETLTTAAPPLNRYRSAGGVVVHDDQVLVLERPRRNELRLPKGHVEPGEPVEKTARREVKEETGLRGLDQLGSLDTIRNLFFHEGRLFVRDETYFLFRWRGKRVKDSEKQFRRRWLSLPDARAGLTFATERYFLRRAEAIIRTRREAAARQTTVPVEAQPSAC